MSFCSGTGQSAADLEGEGALVPAPGVLAGVQGHQVEGAAGKAGVHGHVGAPAIKVLELCRQTPSYSLHRPFEEDLPAHMPIMFTGPTHSRSMRVAYHGGRKWPQQSCHKPSTPSIEALMA